MPAAERAGGGGVAVCAVYGSGVAARACTSRHIV